jgi:hypothetical protein
MVQFLNEIIILSSMKSSNVVGDGLQVLVLCVLLGERLAQECVDLRENRGSERDSKNKEKKRNKTSKLLRKPANSDSLW